MRTEKEIYDLVLNFAFQDERIRIVTLEGSRTNVNIPKDNLQDYDITFFVIDMGEFLKSDDWLSVFGNRIMMQKPEDMELFPPEEKGFSYIMLFDDGVKIDLTLLPVSMLEEYLTRDKLVKIMLDKDNMIKTEIVPTDEDYYIKCPTERKFDDCCNEFWNVATYVSKGLLRGEILFAIDHMNEVLRSLVYKGRKVALYGGAYAPSYLPNDVDTFTCGVNCGNHQIHHPPLIVKVHFFPCVQIAGNFFDLFRADGIHT